MAGQEMAWKRLSESLVVDSSETHSLLDWAPPQSSEDALQETVRWYKQTQSNPNK